MFSFDFIRVDNSHCTFATNNIHFQICVSASTPRKRSGAVGTKSQSRRHLVLVYEPSCLCRNKPSRRQAFGVYGCLALALVSETTINSYFFPFNLNFILSLSRTNSMPEFNGSRP